MKQTVITAITISTMCLIGTSIAFAELGTPTLLYDRAGCTHWCMTGWYASPAIVDLDGNGTMEAIWASYKLWVFDATTGTEYWSVYSGHDVNYSGNEHVGRTWSSPVVGDIDGDGTLEIVTAHSNGWICVYDIYGNFKPGWPVQAAPTSELRSLAAYDFEGDGNLEIVVASTSFGDDAEWYVYEHNGRLRPGWPQHTGDCYAAGCFNQNIAIGDIDQDGLAEVIGPNDTHYICAFQDTGACIMAHSKYEGRHWGQVGVWVDEVAELRGWGHCGTEHRPNFCHAPPVIADLNSDGSLEIVAIGNVHNCDTSPYTDLYEVPVVFNADRSRFKTGSYDWTILPAPPYPGAWEALSQDYGVIESCYPNPTVADIDADGVMEIFYPSHDGKVHGFKLDKTEFGSWPYSVTKPSEDFIRFASEILVADLDGNGSMEIIFGSWTEKASGQTGKLHIMSAMGQPLFEVDVPQDTGQWNGIIGAPTVADIDGNGDLEIIAGTSATGMIAYDLPGASGGEILWGTGRGSNLRNGARETELPDIELELTTNQPAFSAGDTIRVSFGLTNPRQSLDSDLYLLIIVFDTPLFISPEPYWPNFDRMPFRFTMRPMPQGFSMPGTEILTIPLGNDPLPSFSFDWYGLLTSADSLNVLALETVNTQLN